MTLTPGQKLDRYVIEALLGQGGMGQVYRARDPRLQRPVALKVLHTRSPDAAARIEREARAAAALNHPNVVSVYDVGQTDGVCYIAMELVQGRSLRGRMESGAPLADRQRWLLDVARALAAAHGAGIVHRDIKPENVLVRDDGVLKVLDFGIARVTRAVSPEEALSSAVTGSSGPETLTAQGLVVGTPGYMAPEQVRGEAVDARADQFAWGVLAYELLSGRLPWRVGPTPLALVSAVLVETPTPLRTGAPGVPERFADAVTRALEKDPAARFASMADLVRALERGDASATMPVDASGATLAQLPATRVSLPATQGPVRARRPRGRGVARVVTGLALAAVLAVGAVVWRVRARPGVSAASDPPVSSRPEAVAAYAEGLRAYRGGAFETARRGFERAIAADPTCAAAHLRMALLFFHREPAEGLEHLRATQQNQGTLGARDRALLNASEAYLRQSSDLPEWEKRLSEAVARFPRDPELRVFHGLARQFRGNFAGAVADYEAASANDPGFAFAWWLRAQAEGLRGDEDASLRALASCLDHAPEATGCLGERYGRLAARGDCRGAEADARRWVLAEPRAAGARAALARALFAVGAPRDAVLEALSQSWLATPEAQRSSAEARDRVCLAQAEGRFDEAEQHALAWEQSLAGVDDHERRMQVALTRADNAQESGELAAAGRIASEARDRLAAWTASPWYTDYTVSLDAYRMYAGQLTPEAFHASQDAWMVRATERLADEIAQAPERTTWLLWAQTYANPAETPEEAALTLAHRPSGTPPARLNYGDRYAAGKALALAGRAADALPLLQGWAHACPELRTPMTDVRARYYLGLALEATGDRDGARAAYQYVLDHWGSARPASVTASSARARLAGL